MRPYDPGALRANVRELYCLAMAVRMEGGKSVIQATRRDIWRAAALADKDYGVTFTLKETAWAMDKFLRSHLPSKGLRRRNVLRVMREIDRRAKNTSLSIMFESLT